jgi:hypothetical protein
MIRPMIFRRPLARICSLQRLISEAKKLRAPWILNIGSRNVRDALGVNCQNWFENVGKFVGIDLEPGPGVNIVTDASLLSRVIRPYSLILWFPFPCSSTFVDLGKS